MARAEKKQKRWIWNAFCRDTGELIAWECGHPDKATLKKRRLRLEKWKVKVYSTEEWQVYRCVSPRERLIQTKAETHGIARNHCLMRHGFGQFKRKSIIVSKSVEMAELTIALFARFRTNGDVFDIVKLGGMEPNIIT